MNTANWGGGFETAAMAMAASSETIRFEVVPTGGTRLGANFILQVGHRGIHAAALLAEAWNEDLARKAVCMAVAVGPRVHFSGSLSEMKVIRSDGTFDVIQPVGAVFAVYGGLTLYSS